MPKFRTQSRPQWESNPAGKNVRSPFIQSQRSNPLGYRAPQVKGKVYNTIVRPSMVYPADTWAVKKPQYVAEMRVLKMDDSFVMAGPIRHCLLRACQSELNAARI